MKFVLAIAGLLVVTGCGAHPQQAAQQTMYVDDTRQGRAQGRFEYIGQWEHVRGRDDGRFNGTSSRSRHVGDAVVFPFSGSVVRVYGVRGPNGGNASVAIDGQYYGTTSFLAPHKQVGVLVFQSPALPDGAHVLGVVVSGDNGRPHHLYVNIDDVQVLHGQ